MGILVLLVIFFLLVLINKIKRYLEDNIPEKEGIELKTSEDTIKFVLDYLQLYKEGNIELNNNKIEF